MGKNFLFAWYTNNILKKGKKKRRKLEITERKHTENELYKGLEIYRVLKEKDALTDKFLKYIMNFDAKRVIIKGDTIIRKALIGQTVYFYTGLRLERKIIKESMVGFRLCEFENKKKLRIKRVETKVDSEKEENFQLVLDELAGIGFVRRGEENFNKKQTLENERRKKNMERMKYKIIYKKKGRRNKFRPFKKK